MVLPLDVILWRIRDVLAFREELLQKPIGILVGPALPWMVWRLTAAAVLLVAFPPSKYRLFRSTSVTKHAFPCLPTAVSVSQRPRIERFAAPAGRSPGGMRDKELATTFFASFLVTPFPVIHHQTTLQQFTAFET